MTSWRIIEGDCRDVRATLEPRSVQTCVTSPPYFGLRDYGHTGQIGLEPSPDEFVASLVDAFRGLRRVLRDDGTVWLNLGDSYAATSTYSEPRTMRAAAGWKQAGRRPNVYAGPVSSRGPETAKPKDLLGIPWMVAFALRADGWYLRSDIIWAKPNSMPESVTDRPTKAHEYVFLLSKRPRYFYDAAAIRELSNPKQAAHNQRYAKVYDGASTDPANGQPGNVNNGGIHSRPATDGKANKRSVWTVATQPYTGAHFATFPPKLIEPCILAGCPEGGMVFDPFAGAGTAGLMALRHGRSFIGVELNPEYVRLARDRIIADAPLLNTHAELAACR